MKTKKIILFSTLALAAVALCGAAFIKYYMFAAYSYEPVRISVPADASEDDMPQIFTNALGKDFGNKVYNMWRLQKGTPARSHGSYLVEPGEKAFAVARAVAHGRQTPVRLTFNNLRTLPDLAARVASTLECDSATFLTVTDSILGAERLPKELYPTAFIPDTYEFYWTAAPEKIVNTLYKARNGFWTENRLEKAAALGLSPEEVQTLTSIVEEETNKADEQGKVARLYLNRLEKGMALQADPTVKFAVGDFSLRRITSAHLGIDSPYNTYKNTGLPPGPIRIADKGAIDRVLAAPAHNYLYMCAKSDFSGYHDFAADYDRHRINAARYHRALSARGIK